MGPLVPTPASCFDDLLPIEDDQTTSPFMVTFISFHSRTGLSALTNVRAPLDAELRSCETPIVDPIRTASTRG